MTSTMTHPSARDGDFTKALLTSTCTSGCGQCPAWNTEKPLSPKLLTLLFARVPRRGSLVTGRGPTLNLHEDVLGIAERQLIADGDGDRAQTPVP